MPSGHWNQQEVDQMSWRIVDSWRAAAAGMLAWLVAAIAWSVVQSLMQGFVGCEPTGTLKPSIVFWNFVVASCYAVPTALAAGALSILASSFVMKRRFDRQVTVVSALLSLISFIVASVWVSIVILRSGAIPCVLP
jgi:hypothetical protein